MTTFTTALTKEITTLRAVSDKEHIRSFVEVSVNNLVEAFDLNDDQIKEMRVAYAIDDIPLNAAEFEAILSEALAKKAEELEEDAAELKPAGGRVKVIAESSVFTSCAVIASAGAVIGAGAHQFMSGVSIAGIAGGVVGAGGAYFAGQLLEDHFGRTLMTQAGAGIGGVGMGLAGAQLGVLAGGVITTRFGDEEETNAAMPELEFN